MGTKGAAAAGPRAVRQRRWDHDGQRCNAGHAARRTRHHCGERHQQDRARAVHRLRKARQPWLRSSGPALPRRRGVDGLHERFRQGQFVRRHDRPHQRHDPRHCAGGAHRHQPGTVVPRAERQGHACRQAAGRDHLTGDRRQPVICQHAGGLLEPGKRQGRAPGKHPDCPRRPDAAQLADLGQAGRRGAVVGNRHGDHCGHAQVPPAGLFRHAVQPRQPAETRQRGG